MLARPCRGIDRRVLDARDDPAAAEQDKIVVTDADEDADAEGSKGSDPIFILDSGASYHVTSDKWLFRRLDITAAPESRLTTVRRADGALLPVAGTGTVASENFHLPDVLYIPGLMPGKILVSVSQLADLGYYVMFGGGQCRVMDRTGDKLVGQGPLQRDDGFYYRLEFLKIPLEEAAADGTDSKVV